MGRKSGGNADALVVRTDELASVLKLWLDKHNSRFPNVNHNGEFTTGYTYILEGRRSELNERALWRILVREAKHTSLRIADEILTAIDEAGALEDGRITVVPNPMWSQEKWLAWKAEQGCI